MDSRSKMFGFSSQKRKALNLPRSELPSSTSKKQLRNQSGLNSFKSKIGYANLSQRLSIPFLLVGSIFLLSTTFPVETRSINVASHNLHGFKNSSHYHKDCISQYGGVWMGQELWLTQKQLPQLSYLGVQFTAKSGMEDAVSCCMGALMAVLASLGHVTLTMS